MTDPITDRLAMARQIAAEAGQVALGFFNMRDQLVIEAKASPQDIVSRADREVEDLIRSRLAETCPDDAILGEEGGATGGRSGFTWVIDPIDGTSPFLAGLPHWCIAIALVQDEQTVAGVIEVPMAGEQFHSSRGGGAFINDQPIRVSTGTLRDTLVAIGASHRTDPDHVAQVIGQLMRDGGIFYRNGSGALMLASVAAGRLGGYYEPHMHPWDCLAGMLMVEEAGGRCAPLADPLKGGLILTAAPGVWDDLGRVAGWEKGAA